MKKGLTITRLLTIVFALFFVTIGIIGVSVSTAEASPYSYLNLEVYPDGNTFFCGGRSLGNHVKVDVWATPGSEVAFSLGPRLGRFNVGFGASVGMVDGQRDLMYANVDLGFGLDFGRVHVQSYNLHQIGQSNTPNFTLARACFSFGKSPLGIIGHNTKCGNNPWNVFWGPSYDFGRLGPIGSNKLCATVNLNDGAKEDFWFAWLLSF
jgi:hypothetical protein